MVLFAIPLVADGVDEPVSPFDRSLGFRLGLAMQATDMPAAVTPEKTWNLEMASIQLYYYGRWFEADLTWVPGLPRLWQNYENVDNHHIGHIRTNPESESEYVRFALTGYPFRMFNINLGITLGILHHRIDWIRTKNKSSGDQEYSNLLYQSVVTGLTWRFLEQFRVALDLLVPFNYESTYRSVNLNSTHLIYTQKRSLPGISFTFSAFLFRNLSLEAGYQFMVYEIEFKSDLTPPPSANPFGQDLRIYSHRITFSVGYGFNFKK